MEWINELLELSPPIILAIALNAFGYALKKSPIQNWLIPIILPFLGAFIYPLIAEIGKVSFQVTYPAAFNAVIGFLIGSSATWANQALRQFVFREKQADARRDEDGTSFLKKDETKPRKPNTTIDPP